MTNSHISDIREIEAAYADVMHESFLHPYNLKYDVSKNPTKWEAKEWHTKLGIKEAREYLNSLNNERSIRVFLSMGIHDIRRMFYIKYGMEFLGEGSSRITFRATDKSVLKIAINTAGMMQNKAEAHDKNIKNNYGCFPYIFWSSNNNLAIEVEYVEDVSNEQEFEKITGIPFIDFLDTISYSQYIISNKKSQQTYNIIDIPNEYKSFEEYSKTYNDVMAELNSTPTTSKFVLKNLLHYITIKNSTREYIANDLSNIRNWGKVNRRGEIVCIPSDTGGTSFVLDNYYDTDGHPVEKG